MSDEATLGDIITGVMVVALIMIFVRPSTQRFNPLSIITSFSTGFEHAIADTYSAAGIAPKTASAHTSSAPSAPASPPSAAPSAPLSTSGPISA